MLWDDKVMTTATNDTQTECLTPEQVAARLQVSRATVAYWLLHRPAPRLEARLPYLARYGGGDGGVLGAGDGVCGPGVRNRKVILDAMTHQW